MLIVNNFYSVIDFSGDNEILVDSISGLEAVRSDNGLACVTYDGKTGVYSFDISSDSIVTSVIAENDTWECFEDNLKGEITSSSNFALLDNGEVKVNINQSLISPIIRNKTIKEVKVKSIFDDNINLEDFYFEASYVYKESVLTDIVVTIFNKESNDLEDMFSLEFGGFTDFIKSLVKYKLKLEFVLSCD